MKAKIYINRHKVKSNKSNNKDDPCIAVRTYKEVEYAKQVTLSGSWKLKQDFKDPICSGATIWLEGNREECFLEV